MSPNVPPSIEQRTIAVIVDNEPGVLARVIGLFSGRGYNIESLTVTEVDPTMRLSRITIVTSGTPMVLEQIKAQLDRLVPVHGVSDLTQEGPHVDRELALVKVAGAGEKRVESLRIADVFREAGADWREAGCSMCIAMNGDQGDPGEYILSTSNRNFEGRQGKGARTFLASPLTAAATALSGVVSDPRPLVEGNPAAAGEK